MAVIRTSSRVKGKVAGTGGISENGEHSMIPPRPRRRAETLTLEIEIEGQKDWRHDS